MIKAVFIDFDGTIMSHKTQIIPKSTIKAISLLREQGIKVILATGRHKIEMPVFDDMSGVSFDGYMMLNGNMCYDADMNLFAEAHFEGEGLKALLREFSSNRYPLELLEEDAMYINHVVPEIFEKLKVESIATPKRGSYTGNNIYMATAFANREEIEQKTDFPPCIDLVRWHPYGIDFNPGNGGKHNGIRRYMEYFGIDREETMAFGDEENDIRMLEFAGIGVAMGNGHVAAQKAADYVTDEVDDDGIYNALKHFGIIAGEL